MKKTVLLIVFFFCIHPTYSQKLIPFEKDSLWGLKNKKGAIITNPEFDEIRASEHNVYITKKDGLYGLIDQSGNEKIKAEYRTYGFYTSKGIGKLRFGEKYGITIKGKGLLIPVELTGAQILSKKTIAIKRRDKWSLIDKKGELLLKNAFDDYFYDYGTNLILLINGNWQFYHKNELIGFDQYPFIEPVFFNLDVFLYAVNKDNGHGLLSPNGEVIECKYDTLYLWETEYMFMVVEKDGFYGFIDFKTIRRGTKFSVKTECIYPVQENQDIMFIEGNDGSRPFPVYRNGKLGFIANDKVYPAIYDAYDKKAYEQNELCVKQGKKWKTIKY